MPDLNNYITMKVKLGGTSIFALNGRTKFGEKLALGHFHAAYKLLRGCSLKKYYDYSCRLVM